MTGECWIPLHGGFRLHLRASGVLRPTVRALISDQESYPYRIGTVHMSRDAAYADAGVRSGSLLR